MIVETDTYASALSLEEVANILPRKRGKKVSYKTIVRWILKGVYPSGGDTRVRLEGQQIGGQWYVCPEAVTEFINRLSARPGPHTNIVGVVGRPPRDLTTQRRKQLEALNQKLEALGA